MAAKLRLTVTAPTRVRVMADLKTEMNARFGPGAPPPPGYKVVVRKEDIGHVAEAYWDEANA